MCPLQLTKHSGILVILGIGTSANDGAKVEIVYLLVELVDPVAPLLFANLALHVVLVDGRSEIEIGEFGLEGIVDLVVHLGEAQLRPLHLLEDRPVCHEVFNSCENL